MAKHLIDEINVFLETKNYSPNNYTERHPRISCFNLPKNIGESLKTGGSYNFLGNVKSGES